MATKFYFHAANSTVAGTLPTTSQSGLTLVGTGGDATSVNRSMDTTIGAAQTTRTKTSAATASQSSYYFTKWVSLPLSAATISAQTWTLSFTGLEANANANWPTTTTGTVPICCYVWRPSTGARVGFILNGASAAGFVEAGLSSTAISGTFAGSSVVAASGDVIVFELVSTTTQGNATARLLTFNYDGTTEASLTNCASFVSAGTDTLKFLKIVAVSDAAAITVSDSVKKKAIPGGSVSRINELIELSTPTTGIIPSNVSCLTFDRTIPQTVNFSRNAALDLGQTGGSAITAACWMQSTMPNQIPKQEANPIISYRGGNNIWRLFMNNTSSPAYAVLVLELNLVTTGFVYAVGGLPLNDGYWHHIAFTHNTVAGTVVYRDGKSVGTNGDLHILAASAAGDVLQFAGGAGANFTGQIDDVRMYNVALTDTQITQLYNGQDITTGEAFRWKLDENTGTTTTDSIGSVVGTLTGSPVPTWTTTNLPTAPLVQETVSVNKYRSFMDWAPLKLFVDQW